MLTQHEALLDLEDTPTVYGGARFHSPAHWDFPVVDIDIARWVDMGHPRQIVVTIRPVQGAPGTAAAPTMGKRSPV